MMLGNMRPEGTMYRNNEAALTPDGGTWRKHLREAIAALPQGIYRSREHDNLSRPQSRMSRSFAPGTRKGKRLHYPAQTAASRSATATARHC